MEMVNMRVEKQKEELMEKLADAFDKMGLTAITNHCRDEMMNLVYTQVENIIDVYEKEHIVKELLKLHKENPETPPIDILEMIAIILLSEKNFNKFRNERIELDKKVDWNGHVGTEVILPRRFIPSPEFAYNIMTYVIFKGIDADVNVYIIIYSSHD